MKTKIAILFGGESPEHEISIRSARFVIGELDRERYEIVPLAIDLDGKWHYCSEDLVFLEEMQIFEACVKYLADVDVVFPLIHGPMGEDGTIQGLLEFANIPYIGENVLASSVGMDKDVMNRLLRDGQIPIAKFIVHQKRPPFSEVVGAVGLPFFVKPNSMGSSVGMTRVKDEDQYLDAWEDATKYDTHVIIEEEIVGREIECSVLGLDPPFVSKPGEIISHHEFYSFDAKYVDKDGASLEVPANLSPEIVKRVQDLALKAVEVLRCDAMIRVDLFLSQDGDLYINEINTVPGFTAISLYPQMMKVSGIPLNQLVDHLVKIAISKFAIKKTKQRSLVSLAESIS